MPTLGGIVLSGITPPNLISGTGFGQGRPDDLYKASDKPGNMSVQSEAHRYGGFGQHGAEDRRSNGKAAR